MGQQTAILEAAITRQNPVRRVAVILNPAAGRGHGRRFCAQLERLLTQSAGRARWSLMETAARGEAVELAKRACAEGADVVAAAGGDGTLCEVLNGTVGTRARLGVIPLGTGNDFARDVGLTGDPERAVRALFEGTPKHVDLGRAGDRWFINVAGCGFDAVVAERINRGFRYLRGTAAYIAAVLQTLVTFRAAHFCLTVDGEIREFRGMLCAIANSPSYGGGMRVAPEARIDDGLFDICALQEVGKVEFLRAFPRVFRGTHTTHPRVTMLRGRTVCVETDPPLPVLVDGEVVGQTPFDFVLVPAAIEVILP